MIDHVGRVAEMAGVAVPAIAAATQLSLNRVATAREKLRPFRTGGIDVVAFGSMARLETTSESDFDYLVLATSLPREADAPDRLLWEADALHKTWAVEEGRDKPEVSAPGATGVFGAVIGAFDLVDQIGLQQDTNHSLTRRMLLLAESVSLLDEEVHQEVVRNVADLLGELSKSPLARLVSPYDHAPAHVRDAMVGVLGVVDTYLELSGQAQWRATVRAASKADDNPAQEFVDMCEHARTLQRHLETIFFDWDALSADSRNLLAF